MDKLPNGSRSTKSNASSNNLENYARVMGDFNNSESLKKLKNIEIFGDILNFSNQQEEAWNHGMKLYEKSIKKFI